MSVRFGGAPVALLAAALLALAAHSAAANYLAVDSGRFRIVATEMAFLEPFLHGPICHVTLEGSFYSTLIEKVAGREIGKVTSGSTGECTGRGRASFPAASFPWRLKYEGFQNPLPEIGFIRLAVVGLGLEFSYPLEADCIYLSSEASPSFFLIEREFAGENEGRILHVEILGERYGGIANTRIIELPCPSPVSPLTVGRRIESITPPGSREPIHVWLA